MLNRRLGGVEHSRLGEHLFECHAFERWVAVGVKQNRDEPRDVGRRPREAARALGDRQFGVAVADGNRRLIGRHQARSDLEVRNPQRAGAERGRLVASLIAGLAGQEVDGGADASDPEGLEETALVGGDRISGAAQLGNDAAQEVVAAVAVAQIRPRTAGRLPCRWLRE